SAPAAVYFMVDQSAAMSDPLPNGSGTWWDAVTAGLRDFFRNPAAQNLTVGIQYFPLDGSAPASCLSDYTTPEIELAPLSENADALVNSLSRHAPTGARPLTPATWDGLVHLWEWSVAHPGYEPVLVLLTSGLATECSPTSTSEIAS